MTHIAPEHDKEPRESAQEKRFRKVFIWVVLLATTAWGIFAGTFLGYHSLQQSDWLLEIFKVHFAALFLVPMAALMSMCVVVLLRYTAGAIEFKGLGFDFKGASGQVVLWVFCFLALIAALKLLWYCVL